MKATTYESNVHFELPTETTYIRVLDIEVDCIILTQGNVFKTMIRFSYLWHRRCPNSSFVEQVEELVIYLSLYMDS